MSPTPIVAPYVPSYAATEPYITAAEFKAGATGVNVSALVPNGDAAAQLNALQQKIAGASGAADSYCNQPLACTRVVQYGRYFARNGRVLVPTEQMPVIAVESASLGVVGAMQPLSSFDAVTFPSQNVVELPFALGRELDSTGRAAVQLTYLAGFANALLTADAVQGATVLTLGDTLGMYPGMILQIMDPGKDERVTVTAVTDTMLTLSAGTSFAHAAGARVTAMPPAITQAVILLTAVLIKTRASESVVLSSMNGGQMSKQVMDPSAATQLAQAVDLLSGFRRVA
ncbi:MAG: hypothetical protein AB7T06_24715 [Kofleriaceae bacterium]